MQVLYVVCSSKKTTRKWANVTFKTHMRKLIELIDLSSLVVHR